MLRFSERKVATEEVYRGKKPPNIWDVNVDNIVISGIKNNSKYSIVCLSEVIRPLVLILTKMSEYIKR